MLPKWDNPNNVPIFRDFIKDDYERTHASWAQRGDQGWQIRPKRIGLDEKRSLHIILTD
jgi:hypothetical protein